MELAVKIHAGPSWAASGNFISATNDFSRTGISPVKPQTDQLKNIGQNLRTLKDPGQTYPFFLVVVYLVWYLNLRRFRMISPYIAADFSDVKLF